MFRRLLSLVVLTALAAPAAASAADKPKKPRLELRALPRFAFSPANILLIAELSGGEDVEDMHCPQVEWEWDDGGKSVQESDCPPFETGKTKVERRFSTEHQYRRAGVYNVKVTLKKSDRPIAVANVKVTVRPGIADQTMEREL